MLPKPRAVATIAMVCWLMFLLLDGYYQFTVVPTDAWPESENYGPIRFFRELLKWALFALAAVVCVGLYWRDKDRDS